MNDRTQRQILLAKRPRGEITEDCYEHVERPVPTPAEGEALVRVLYISLDPTIRGWMNDVESYMPPMALGEPVRAGAVAEVVESRTEAYEVGERLFGMFGWQEYTTVAAGAAQKLPPEVEPTDALGVFGITGMTAYFGMLDVARPKEGETVVVSGAAGATGSVAGQIAKIQGCRVVGLAGTPEKCRWVTEDLGFDACIDYRLEDVSEGLRKHCPNGIDVYFDNVGGEILDAVLAQINQRARIALCGAISGYNDEELPAGPRNLMQAVVQRARLEGFIVIDYIPRFPEAMQDLARWVAEGRVNHRTTVVEGLEHTPEAFQRLFTGGNTGKLLVKVADAG